MKKWLIVSAAFAFLACEDEKGPSKLDFGDNSFTMSRLVEGSGDFVLDTKASDDIAAYIAEVEAGTEDDSTLYNLLGPTPAYNLYLDKTPGVELKFNSRVADTTMVAIEVAYNGKSGYFNDAKVSSSSIDFGKNIGCYDLPEIPSCANGTVVSGYVTEDYLILDKPYFSYNVNGAGYEIYRRK